MTLVPLDGALCPTCGSELLTVSWWEPSLLRHGGYGATRRTRVRWCPDDGWSIVSAVEEVSPR